MPLAERTAVLQLTPELMRRRLGDALDVYLAAMNYGREWKTLRYTPWERATAFTSWRAYAAFIVPSPEDHLSGCRPGKDPLVGIAFGYRGDPHSWWSDKIRAGMEKAGYQDSTIEHVLGHYFELSELHVLPQYQGHGLGRELLNRILDDHHEDYTILSTPEVPAENNAAWQLYRSLGFQDLLRDFTFPGDQRHFGILIRK